MSRIAMIFGAVLITLGVAFYFGTGAKSPTAFIPSGFGILLIICGAIATKPELRKHAMHGAAVVGLLGTLAPLGMAVPKAFRGNLGPAVIEQLLMAAICLVFLVLCIRSFIAARRARNAAPPAP